MADYGAELPLWLSEWWELGLSRSLLNHLADWQHTFDMNFDHEAGWISVEIRNAWRAEADRLVARLRKEVPHGVEIQVDLWPL